MHDTAARINDGRTNNVPVSFDDEQLRRCHQYRLLFQLPRDTEGGPQHLEALKRGSKPLPRTGPAAAPQ
eukprot:scaffold265646_cov15-Tisochrysis_lutea.AAC.1